MEQSKYTYGCGCISQGSVTIRKCDKCLSYDLTNIYADRYDGDTDLMEKVDRIMYPRDEVTGLGDTLPIKPNTDKDAALRKSQPVYSGVLKYFPDALLEVAKVSKLGNDQHNPGEPMHWAREKSTDQLDAAVRHILDYAKGIPIDSDGGSHLAKAAWRILAQLQLLVEAEKLPKPCHIDRCKHLDKLKQANNRED